MIKSLRRKFIVVVMCSTIAVLAVIMGIIHIYSYKKVMERADQLLAILGDNQGEFPLDIPGENDMEEKIPEGSALEGIAVEKEISEGRTMEKEVPEGTTMEGDAPEGAAMEKEAPEGTAMAEDTPEGAAPDGSRSEESPHGEVRSEKRPPAAISPETPYETRYFSVLVDKDGAAIETKTRNIAAVTEAEAREYASELWNQKKLRGFCGAYRYKIVPEENGSRVIFVDCTRELGAFYSSLEISVGVSFVGLLLVLLLVVIFSKKIFRPVMESYEKQRQFITDASHELKTPLTIIDANTEVLEMTAGENEWTRSIRRQVKRLSAMTQQLVTLSKMEEGDRAGSMADFSLSDAVEETTELFLPSARIREKRMEVQIEGGIIYHGDEGMIRQMLSLLMDNALKYSDEKGNIRVLLQRKGKKVMLQVTNTVEEIEKGNLDLVFERFYRRDASHNSGTGGSGIGLSVVKAVVDAHGGKIHAVSRDGKSIEITAIL